MARTSLHKAGKEARLSLLPENQITLPDQLLYVHLRVTDDRGTVKPGLRGDIPVIGTGRRLLALGNACSYHERGSLTDITDTCYGEALAIIRPGGDVMLTAQSPFGEARLTLRCEGRGNKRSWL